ncbi:AbrB family transcriptional regulator [Shimia sp. CNT1-13L.2]|uniref:AbrB family transcriptional regulator n=1 Tax=Shimia sp. CNT1-13L.2 TaxID=2959663 RepID=UPI0020CE2691|nr:AbrB family transcriptional regulator [Shimia sp. CNT1-13L.2]MCP9483856.1 AbrB family transcriptional regulator [Shimia sp. CNT1-13L.2]
MKDLKSRTLQLTLVLVPALAGAFAALAMGWPIPFLLGSLVATAILALTFAARTGYPVFFPKTLREVFIAVIGTMIGATFTPDVLSMAPTLAVTLCAMVGFVVLAQASNYVIFHHLGGYDRPTSFYAAMPGGLIEAVEMGTKAGGDVETLSIQHFVRIVLVILIVPLLFLVVTGEAVGSAASQALERGPSDWNDWLMVAAIAPAGLWIGKASRLPAAPLLGPLVLTAILQSSGGIDLDGPPALLNLAQLIVGASLGAQFAKTTPRRLVSAVALGFVSVMVTLAIASAFSLMLGQFLSMSFQTLLISFAPGGVTEMSLVALSLGVSPVLVSTHHLFRILFTVGLAGLLFKRFGNSRPEP